MAVPHTWSWSHTQSKLESEKWLNIGGHKGCKYCGGLGHRIADCPKRESANDKKTALVGRSDFVRDGGGEF